MVWGMQPGCQAAVPAPRYLPLTAVGHLLCIALVGAVDQSVSNGQQGALACTQAMGAGVADVCRHICELAGGGSPTQSQWQCQGTSS